MQGVGSRAETHDAAGGGVHLLEADAQGADELHSRRREVRRLPRLVVLFFF